MNLTAAFLSLTLFASGAFAQPVTAVLRLKGKVSLQELADDVRNPDSPRFGKPYSPEEIRNLSGPVDSDYNQLVSQLEQEGFQIAAESPTHLWISIKGDSSLFDQSFGSKIKVSNKMRMNMAEINPPARLNLVEAVTGLDNTRRSKPRVVKRGTLTSAPGGVAQATIKTAYGFDAIYQSGLSGKGQDIAVATYDGFNISDVQYFYTNSKLSPGPVVDQVAFNGTAAYNEDSAIETELDAEFSGMMAPGANIHVFASATNDDAGELQLFTAILDDNRSKVVNYSWGDCETNVTPSHQTEMAAVFARAVAQGVNIMNASGDSGSDSCGNGGTVADWPAANPNVVAVGGTTFSQNGNQIAETAWSGSGGGISGLFALPTWQSSLGAPYVRRSYPDVSFNADPASGQAIYTTQGGKQGWLVIGGTSMAAPQWSGFMALVGEARQKSSKATLGFLDPIIYGLNSAQRTSAFNDITSGSNGAYSAGPGWDAVTGWGSMQATSLLNLLTGN